MTRSRPTSRAVSRTTRSRSTHRLPRSSRHSPWCSSSRTWCPCRLVVSTSRSSRPPMRAARRAGLIAPPASPVRFSCASLTGDSSMSIPTLLSSRLQFAQPPDAPAGAGHRSRRPSRVARPASATRSSRSWPRHPPSRRSRSTPMHRRSPRRRCTSIASNCGFARARSRRTSCARSRASSSRSTRAAARATSTSSAASTPITAPTSRSSPTAFRST